MRIVTKGVWIRNVLEELPVPTVLIDPIRKLSMADMDRSAGFISTGRIDNHVAFGSFEKSPHVICIDTFLNQMINDVE